MLILSLDGGGIRGCFTARILQRLSLLIPGWLDKVDLFVGTSTGSIIAAGLAFGITPGFMVDLYIARAKEIFSALPEYQVLSLDGVALPKYPNDGLSKVLRALFDNWMLNHLKRDVLITTYDCTKMMPVDLTRSDIVPIADAIMRSAAPPYYLPSFEGFVDGGVSANNPSLAAVTWAVSQGHALDSIHVLSLGTGTANPKPLNPAPNWGGLEWLKRGLVDLLLDAPAQRASSDCRLLLGERFHRLDGSVDCALDASDDLFQKLVVPADQIDLSATETFLKSISNRSEVLN